MRRLSAILAAFAFQAFFACASAAPAMWYEDNNLGRGGGMPPDFIEKFRQPEAFSQATRHIRVYLLRAIVLDKMDDAFLADLLGPYLRDNGIKLAINAAGATWAQAKGRRGMIRRDMRVMQRLKQAGIELHYISLQSVLSKTLVRDGKVQEYPMSQRIDDIVAYAKAAREIFPAAEIGIIDALPSHGKDYRAPYRQLKDGMAREGLALSYIHLDMPFEFPARRINGASWPGVREVERYVEDELGLQFGFFVTSKEGGVISSRAFHDKVMAALDCYLGAEGTPRDLVIASWFPHPRTTIPETATGDDYPAMRTVLEFGRRLDQIGKAGPTWAAGRTRQREWRAMCIA